MEKRNGNDRSMTSKMLFGTFLSNGLVVAAAGFFGLIAALYYKGSEHNADLYLLGGGILLLVGVCLLSVHFYKTGK